MYCENCMLRDHCLNIADGCGGLDYVPEDFGYDDWIVNHPNEVKYSGSNILKNYPEFGEMHTYEGGEFLRLVRLIDEQNSKELQRLSKGKLLLDRAKKMLCAFLSIDSKKDEENIVKRK